MASGSLTGFLQSGIEQVVYPPGYSWLAAPLVVWLGAETATLRGLSLLWFLLTTLVTWRAASNLSPERPGLAGLIASLLVLTSAPSILFASNVLLDSIGLLAVFIFLHVWGQLDSDPTWRRALATGVLAGACFWLKYPFGVFAGAALTAGTAFDMARRRSAKPRREEWLALGSAALVVGLYLVLPGRFEDALTYGTLQPSTTSIWALGNLIYYGQSLVTQYSVSPSIGAIVLAAVVLASLMPARKAIFRWALFFWVGYGILTLKSANEPRFGAVVLPAAFVVAAALIANGLDVLIRLVRDRRPVTVAWAGLQVQVTDGAARRGVLFASGFALLILAITTAHGLSRRITTFPTMLALGYKTDALAVQHPFDYSPRPDNLNGLYEFVSASIADSSPRVLVLNTFNELNAPAIGWRLAADRLGVPGAEVIIWPHYAYERYPDDYASFRERLIAENIEYIIILRDARYGSVHAGPRGLTWYLRHDLGLLGSELFNPTILEDAVTLDRLLANYEFGPPELEGRFRGLSKEWPHVVDVFRFVPGGFADSPLPNLYGLLDLPLDERNYVLPSPQSVVGAALGDKVELLGFDLIAESGRADMTLYWRGLNWMNEDYHVFIHLIDPASGELVFGHDFIPGGGYPIQWWAPGEIVAEAVALDMSGVAPGEYRLGVG
ncbi:MAG: ArnT family glycosyltransferase, partial [Anaerolineales bacterium]